MLKKEVFAWSVYDLANTAFSALFVTFFFPLYVKQYLGGNEFQIGLVFGLSMLLVAITVPFIGALSDRLGRRMPFIILFTILCCTATYLVVHANLAFALMFGFIANYFYHAALTVYNAILPKISSKQNVGKISGIGVSVGYIGTFLSLLMTWGILHYLGWETISGVKAMFPATAMFFIGFSLITFFVIKDTPSKHAKLKANILQSFSDVKHTIVRIKHHKNLLWFLISTFMYVNAINAVIVFLYLYGRSEIGLTVKAFMGVYIVFSLAAAIGALIFGKITDWIGPKKTLGISGVLWIITLFVLLKTTSLTTFIIGGILGGIALGSVWTAMRPLLLQIAPKKKEGQFFGFMELSDKFSGVIGPIVFGFLAVRTGYFWAIISLLIFFILGLLALHKVKIK
ncbi:MFS transporter [Candidatus Woesearchaeota archaeon]|nr:MFS transporter [Candidatus Woesearchaeota archaeon]